ncbi:hypothetical protein HIM_08670 [Hirsutella minnesotensis 3608]|uniref:Uncharacterized protein n=1 Tax=Hirsutella minnesotensis 3608 TaxID=1043627 RepID=A0A0F8A3J0_9HYPO|nr:hypothetical protein HIM_08670 [Hirsutella minnesotensis 3608]
MAEDDDVYPVHILDGYKVLQGCMISYLFYFHQVLDAQRLADAMTRLLELGDWRKLRGRFRRKGNGKLEVHVPRTPRADCPAIGFHHDEFEGPIDSHPLARHFSIQSTEGSQTFRAYPDFRPLVGWPHVPQSVDDLIRREAPQIGLYVTSFTDATLVGVSWMHPSMDGMGMRTLLRNWSLVLNGRENEVADLSCARRDVLESLLPGDDEKAESLIRGPAPCTKWWRTTLPRLWWLARAAWKGSSSQPLHVSEANVLAAWLARTLYWTRPQPRAIQILTIIDARFRLPQLRGRSGDNIIQNVLMSTHTPLPSGAVQASLGATALAHRRTVAELASEPEATQFFRHQFEHVEMTGDADFGIRNPPRIPVLYSDMAKSNLLEAVDLAAAVVGGRRDKDQDLHQQGRPRHMVVVALAFPPGIEVAAVGAKDQQGNRWVTGWLQPRSWDALRREVDRMAGAPDAR